ncbi:MAG: hypothetical protein WDN08_15445 [Rhizomicrobium sp.]
MGVIRPTGETFVIAARIAVPPRRRSPTGRPPPWQSRDSRCQPRRRRRSGNRPADHVIVMADSDIFDDRFWVHVETAFGKRVAAPFADNGAFVLNAIENLTGSSDLITLRTRATNDRPFTVVKQIQAQAQAQFQAEAEALQARMTAVQQRLHELEQGGGASNAQGLTQAQQAEIDRFKKELIDTRTALRDVQHNLRKDIDTLGSFLAIVNIVLVPVLVAGFAIVLAWARRRRRARALAQ